MSRFLCDEAPQDTDVPWVWAPAGLDVRGRPVPVIVCDRIKKEMQVEKARALCLHVGFCWKFPQCNYGHGWPAMTAHLLASQSEYGALRQSDEPQIHTN